MQIIIEIPDDKYNKIIDNYDTFPSEMRSWGLEAIKHGVPLLKGHGRLIDESKVNKCYINNNLDTKRIRTDAPTIIKADRRYRMIYNVGVNGKLRVNLDTLDEWNLRDFKKLLDEMDTWKYQNNNYPECLSQLYTAAYKLEDSYSRMYKISHTMKYEQIRQRMEKFMILIYERRAKIEG